MTQEFQVSVTPVGSDEYLIRTERVAPGVPLAEEQVVWAVEDWLAQARQLMNDPLLTILRGTGGASAAGGLRSQAPGSTPLRSGTSAEPPQANSIFDLVSLGQCLYGALFQGTIRDSWMTAQGIAQHRQDLLRLRLGLKGDRLWRLPWEVLHRGDRPITTGTDVVFSRYQFGQGMVRPLMQTPNLALKPGQPLRILMAIAAPTDQERLDLAREARHLQEELLASSAAISSSADYSTSTAIEIQLTILEQPDREQLTRELEQGHYQVLHYAGHSNLGAAGGDLYLVSGRTGLTETLSGDDLAGLLVNNGIRLAVFNSCRSAYTTDAADSTSEQNLAEALIRRGVPAVLAMAERIPDEVALTLTRLFYRNLKQGYAIDLSLNRTRQGLLSAYGSNQLYWALPILYLNPDFDGCLVSPVAGQRAYLDAGQPIPALLAENPQEIWADRVPASQMATDNAPSSQTAASGTAGPMAIAAFDQASDQLSDLVDDWENEHHSGTEKDTEALSELIQQLSQPGLQESDPVEHDVRRENLLPDDAAVLKSRLGESSTQPLPTVSVSAPTEGQRAVNHQDSLNESRPDADMRQPTSESRTTAKLIISTTPTKTEATPGNRSRNIALGLLGGIAIGGGVIWGLWMLAQWRPQSSQISPSSPVLTQPLNVDRVNLKAIKTPNLMAIAITRFNQGDLAAGGQAMEELLDRVALKEAAEVLAAVPTTQTGDAYISFLRGRLAWQYLQQPENVPYSLDDVRRSWETAVRQDSKSALYRNALGFAYYAEGRLSAAQEQWSTAMELATSKSSTSQSVAAKNADALTASAGIALAFAAAAEGKPPAEREQLLTQAVKGYQAVMAQDPINFQQQALGKNWLWTEEAIRQWVALGKQS